ncbi:hypothetical protein HanPSC8_Chr01g0040881 [Helianthus annuus]|nr:hypothetical protein HanPSC8_Chr01g0040881 [Helianthus annuus]
MFGTIKAQKDGGLMWESRELRRYKIVMPIHAAGAGTPPAPPLLTEIGGFD